MNELQDKREHIFSKIIMSLSACILIIVLGFVDFLTGYEFDFSLFYLVPILLIAWFIGQWPGIAIAAFSSVVWLVADKAAGHPYTNDLISFWNMIIRLAFFTITSLFLSAIKSSFDREDELSRTDSLTGILNGLGFIEEANDEINRSRRYKQPLTIAYIGLNNVKTVNEKLGHSSGDLVLKKVAECIQRNIRAVDTVSRIGGDEYAILLPQTDPEQAEAAITKIQKGCIQAVELGSWPITFSIGVVTFFSAPTTIDEMIRIADGLMYTAKEEGQNVIKYKVSD